MDLNPNFLMNRTQFPQVFESVSASDFLIRIQSGLWIRIRSPDPDPGGQKLPIKTNRKKLRNVMF